MSEIKVVVAIDIGPNLKEVMQAAIAECGYASDIPPIIESFDLRGIAKEALTRVETEVEDGEEATGGKRIQIKRPATLK